MLKKSLLIAIGALLTQGALATTLSPEAALKRAQASGARHLSSQMQPKLAYTGMTQAGAPALYVFNQQGGGTLILSASDAAIPVLGYTDNGSFDPSNVPPQMQWWLEEYASQIAYAEAHDLAPKSTQVGVTYPTSWKYVAPLVKTQWDQGKPYNSMLTNSTLATGCVATAMAQVMNYWKFPERGHGSNSYTDAYGKSYSMDFETTTFDWANMLNSYKDSYSQTEADAVATLMKACGVATNMNYGTQSGTQVELSAIGLVKYFGYNNKIQSLQRYGYTTTQWATMLYEQLTNYGPVIYSGHSLMGYAHAFVCDGYDGNGYFHINWGWSGTCDGFYSIDAMIPSVQGTGGSEYGGYNFSQGMITNITKGSGDGEYEPLAMLTLLGNVSGTNSSSVLTLTMTEANPGNICNNSMVKIVPSFGIRIENTETGQESYVEATSTLFAGNAYTIPAMGPGSYVDPQFSMRVRFDSSLPAGHYKVTMVWRDKTAGTPWSNFEIANGCHDYVYVTKGENPDTGAATYSVQSLEQYRFKVTGATVLTPLYMRNPVQIKFDVSNPYDIELAQSIIPVLFYEGTLSFEGDSQVVTVGPNETKSVTLTYTFSTVTGGTSPTTSTPRTYTLGAYDYSLLLDRYYMTGYFAESSYGTFGEVEMKRSTSNPSINLRGISINNAVEQGQVEDLGYFYGLNNFKDIGLEVKIEGKSGFISSPLTAIVYEYDPEERKNGDVVYEKNFEDLLFIASGETVNAFTVLHMTDVYDVEKIYSAVVYYNINSSRVQLGSVRFGASTGIENVTIDMDGELFRVFNLNGVNVLNTTDRDELRNLPKGIYIVNGKKVVI